MQRERGFSLIELMVALVMTLIVSGAIYGLMTSGQGAFRREPALIDRQQNIRVAMDMIVRDLENAGSGMSGSVEPTTNGVPPPLSQIFTTGLDGVGIPSAIYAGQNSDMLEFFTADGSCPVYSACQETTSGVVTLTGVAPANGCMGRVPNDTLFAYVSGPNPNGNKRSFTAQSFLTPGIMFLSFQGNVVSGCSTVIGTGNAPRMQFNAPGAPGINDAVNCLPGINNPCLSVVRVNRVRYELAGENPAQAISSGPPLNPLPLNPPCLWRSEYGRFNRDGTINTGPNTPPGPLNPWEMVARGIDDLQVDYQAGGVPLVAFNPAPGTGPVTVPPVVPALLAQLNTDTVVRRVRITLSARAITQEPGGSRYATNNVAAVEPGRRGQLTTIVTPRPALATLAQESDQTRNWR